MALRRMYCFDKLPKGIIDNADLPSGLNRGNGLSYMNDPALIRVPESDATNPFQINDEGWAYCPQTPVIGSAVPRMLKISPTVFGAGWTKQCYGVRVKIHREESYTTSGSSPNIALFDLSGTTVRFPILTFNEILAALGGYFREGYFEIEVYIAAGILKADVYLNNELLKTATISGTPVSRFTEGVLAMTFACRATTTQQRSTSLMFKDIIAYDDVLDQPDSLVTRPGPIRVKPIYLDDVAGVGWTGPDATLSETVNRTLQGVAANNPHIQNDSAENPLTMKVRVDIDRNLPILGVCFDTTLNTVATNRLTYDLKLKEGDAERSVLSGTANNVPVWGLTSPTLDTDANGEKWTVDSLNAATMQLNVATG